VIGGNISFGGTGNTLTLAPSSVIYGPVNGSGSDTLQLGGSGTGTFYVSQLSASNRYSGYQGFATLNKVESSTWTLVGTSPFTGSINVNAGALDVAGSVADASLLTVNSGGLLFGVGTIGGTNVMNGGIFAPGSGVAGTSMSVTGNLTFQSGGIYQVQVSPSAASFSSVAGKATLGGATVSAVFAPGSYIQKSYTILAAGGGVSGNFAPIVTTNMPSILATLSYDPNDVYLNLGFRSPSGRNANEQAVGNAITNYFNANGTVPAAFGYVTPSGLTQASGESATGSQQTTFSAMNQFMGLLTDPFMQRSSSPGSTGPTGFSEEDVSSYAAAKQTDAFAMFTKARPAPFIQRWSVWAAGFGGSQSTDGNAVIGSNNTTSSIYGTAVGADYLFSPNTLAGFALAGGGTNFSVNGLGSGRSDLFQAGAYLRHSEGPAYFAAALAYGWQDITTNRIVSIAGIDQLRAEFNANTYSGRLEGGYRFIVPWAGGFGILCSRTIYYLRSSRLFRKHPFRRIRLRAGLWCQGRH
jgi:autotransporter-associated beta strand protein